MLISMILIREPEVRASARGSLVTIPGVDPPLFHPPARPWGERRPLTFTAFLRGAAQLSCAEHSARRLSIEFNNLTCGTFFSLSCTRASADFLRPVVALRTESACRVEALSRTGVALARLAGLCGLW